jgi:uncharacterized protein (DUF2235 family)
LISYELKLFEGTDVRQYAHELHCVYVWRNMDIALRHDRPLVDASDAYRQVIYCSDGLANILQAEPVPVRVKYFA